MRPRYNHYKYTGARITARGIVIHNNNILLIERWRDNLHYFSIPGGGVDEGEILKDAVKREIREESTIEVEVERLLYDITDSVDGHRHYIFLCNYINGEPHLPDDSEEAHAGPHNKFLPCWMPLEKLETISFKYWEHVRNLLLDDLKSGFKKDVKITSF